MEYLYTKEQAAVHRQKIVDTNIVPVVKANFAQYPQLKSAALLVAQYWNDEADDEVHHWLVYSILDTPDITSAAKQCGEDKVNLPGISNDYDGALRDEAKDALRNLIFDGTLHKSAHNDRKELMDRYLATQNTRVSWDGNYSAIPAFAAFCREGCHQEMEMLEAYSLYAIIRRQAENLEIEIVGKMLRPWLDGVKPEEDNPEEDGADLS